MSKKFGMQVIFGSSNLSPNNGPFIAVLHCPCSPGPYKIKLFFSPTRGAAVKFKPKRGKGIAVSFPHFCTVTFEKISSVEVNVSCYGARPMCSAEILLYIYIFAVFGIKESRSKFGLLPIQHPPCIGNAHLSSIQEYDDTRGVI